MKIYLDLVFVLNFFFDFLLLFATNYILKRKTKLLRIFLGALTGALSIFFLFIPLNSLSLFLLKILVSILMILITFPYEEIKSFLKNIGYFYLISVFLGGALYLVNLNLSYKNEGIIFFHNGLSINIVLMIVLTPVIIYLYIKEVKAHKNTYNNYRNISIYLKQKQYDFTGYIDTGNQLKDPIKKRSVILLYTEIDFPIKKFIYVPFKALNSSGVVKCFKADKVIIEGKEYNDLLIGLSKEKFHIEGVDCILPNKLKEELDEKNN